MSATIFIGINKASSKVLSWLGNPFWITRSQTSLNEIWTIRIGRTKQLSIGTISCKLFSIQAGIWIDFCIKLRINYRDCLPKDCNKIYPTEMRTYSGGIFEVDDLQFSRIYHILLKWNLFLTQTLHEGGQLNGTISKFTVETAVDSPSEPECFWDTRVLNISKEHRQVLFIKREYQIFDGTAFFRVSF